MQHLKKILRLSVIQIWTKIESFIYQKFWKNWSLWFSPQKMCKFLSNSVHFLDSHSWYAQNDSFSLGPTSFLKKSRIFRSLGGSCEKWQPISRQKGGFHPPPHLLGLNMNYFWMMRRHMLSSLAPLFSYSRSNYILYVYTMNCTLRGQEHFFRKQTIHTTVEIINNGSYLGPAWGLMKRKSRNEKNETLPHLTWLGMLHFFYESWAIVAALWSWTSE